MKVIVFYCSVCLLTFLPAGMFYLTVHFTITTYRLHSDGSALREQRWCTGESTRMPPTETLLKSRRGRRTYVFSPLLQKVFLRVLRSGSTLILPSPQKPTFLNSNSRRNHQVEEEPFSGCATSKLFIYLYSVRSLLY